VVPAAAVGTQADALLGRELLDAAAQRGVAVAVDVLALRGLVGVQRHRAAPVGDRGVHVADERRIDLDQGQVVEVTGVLVGLALLLHGQPRAVGQRAAADLGALTGQAAALDEVDLRAERE
jgi:hypothetical protein